MDRSQYLTLGSQSMKEIGELRMIKLLIFALSFGNSAMALEVENQCIITEAKLGLIAKIESTNHKDGKREFIINWDCNLKSKECEGAYLDLKTPIRYLNFGNLKQGTIESTDKRVYIISHGANTYQIDSAKNTVRFNAPYNHYDKNLSRTAGSESGTANCSTDPFKK